MLTTVSLVTTTMNNMINKDVTQKQRGDVHIPRHHSYNQLWEFDIELGNTDDYARDDSKVGVLHCTFDHGVCDWMSDREGDVHWETTHNSEGHSYLSVPELKAGQRSIRGARLGVQIAPPWSQGDGIMWVSCSCSSGQRDEAKGTALPSGVGQLDTVGGKHKLH
ncbi:hypothetical protein Q8A73_012595 [Channa argus]|nr:hypothetical protein Q8A73_012595 [Channa argus]